MKKWYILHTLSGAEDKAKANLEARIGASEFTDVINEVVIPKEQITEVKLGKKKVFRT